MTQLIQYIFVAILSWVPVANLTPYGETEDEVKARLHSVAEDIVTVAMDANEPPVFARADGRVKTALLHAAIASMETGFQKFVDDGSCNRADYHADRRGDCDGRHAWSLWQIHISGNGYILQDDGSLGSAMYAPVFAKEHPELVIQGPQLVADRKVAIRVAQRIERTSLRQFHSLCAYSGESCEDDRHPKAKVRMDRAVDYFTRHPFTDTIPEPVANNSSQTESARD
jgi:hypothetical protein